MGQHIRWPFARWIKPLLAGKPIRYLEIGVDRGSTAWWMFQHVLTHPDSRADFVDPWQPFHSDRYGTIPADTFYEPFVWMMQPYIGSRCCIHRMTSERFFYSLQQNDWFDLIFIDGDHSYEGVKLDACWAARRMLCGLIVFDDMKIPGVRQAVTEFEKAHDGRITQFYATRHQRCFAMGDVLAKWGSKEEAVASHDGLQ